MANYVNNATILDGLTKYRDELSFNDILIESIFSARTLSLVKVQTGVKGTQAINLMTSNPVFTEAQCGLVGGTGSVTFAQRDITVSDISQNEDICLVGDNSLSKYYLGSLQKPGMRQEELTPELFAKAFIADKMLQTKNFIEKLIWVGSKTNVISSAPGMDLANGFLHILKFTSATSSIVDGGGTYSGALTEANAIDVVKKMVDAVPQDIADKDLILFVSLPNYRKIVNALISSNNYHFTAVDSSSGPEWTIKFPFAHNVSIVATSGLQGRNEMVLTYPENMFVGTDAESDYDSFDVWYSKDLNAIRYRSQFRIGTQIAFPQYVVYYKG